MPTCQTKITSTSIYRFHPSRFITFVVQLLYGSQTLVTIKHRDLQSLLHSVTTDSTHMQSGNWSMAESKGNRQWRLQMLPNRGWKGHQIFQICAISQHIDKKKPRYLQLFGGESNIYHHMCQLPVIIITKARI